LREVALGAVGIFAFRHDFFADKSSR
jgi:hypothetical protein